MSFFKQSVALLLSAHAAHAALTYYGNDWSSSIVEEKAGIEYKDINSSNSEPLETIMVNNGMNIVRQRVWVTDGDYGLDYNLELAKRAKAAGLEVHVNLHFSESFADPGKQAIPSGWPTDIDGLEDTLYQYTLNVSNTFADAGIYPVIMDIGNEVSNGLLFPVGQLSNLNNIARLLHSASAGIKDSKLNPQPLIEVHLNAAAMKDLQVDFYTKILAQGPFLESDFDCMGLAYYPYYGAIHSLAGLNESMHALAATWGKKIMMAEINFPTSCPSPAQPFPDDIQDIPISADGQVEFVRRVANLMESVPGALGIEYWEAGWVNNQALGSSCESNTLFSWPGDALSSLDLFTRL